jgi:hypothetical protein
MTLSIEQVYSALMPFLAERNGLLQSLINQYNKAYVFDGYDLTLISIDHPLQPLIINDASAHIDAVLGV